MNFNQFLRESDYSTNTELVGLTIYYLEEYEEEDSVTSRQIQDCLSKSRAKIDVDSVSARLRDLSRHKDYVKSSQEHARLYRYHLTFEGYEYFSKLAGEANEEEKVRDKPFIDTDIVEAHYYQTLIEDINKSYQYGINDATLVLTRKLFENLLIDILRAKYGGEGIDLYFNTNIRQFHGLGNLTKNLKENLDDFDHIARPLDEDLIESIEEFKERGDSGAHSVRVDVEDSVLERMSDEATSNTDTLYLIRQEVRVTGNG